MHGYSERGLATLKQHRDGKGRWGRFPFWYTLLAVSELHSKAAVAELRYAAPVLERSVKRPPHAEAYAQRRQALAERVLASC